MNFSPGMNIIIQQVDLQIWEFTVSWWIWASSISHSAISSRPWPYHPPPSITPTNYVLTKNGFQLKPNLVKNWPFTMTFWSLVVCKPIQVHFSMGHTNQLPFYPDVTHVRKDTRPSPVSPYWKWRKAGRGLGMRLGHTNQLPSKGETYDQEAAVQHFTSRGAASFIFQYSASPACISHTA